MATQNDEMAILQPAEKIRGQPDYIRVDFIKKVYGIMTFLTLTTFGLASPFVFYEAATVAWFKNHMWILVVCFVFLIAQHVFHLCMMAEMCSGGHQLMSKYLWMFKTVPWNFVYMTTYAVAMGVVVGYICLQYKASSVCLIFLLCAALFLALTAYAVYTKADFTGSGAYILVAMVGLMGLGIVGIFVPIGSVFHRVVGAIGSIIFGWIIVYDTQLIFGCAVSSDRKYEYTIDMYAFAAFELYLDFVNFFLFMLRFLGERK